MTMREAALLIYAEYPRKVGRAPALEAIMAAFRRGETMEFLLERTKTYKAATDTWDSDDRQFIPHPRTWYAQDRFHDDEQEWFRKGSQPEGWKPTISMDDAAKMLREDGDD